jgi:hypothetical protein
MGVSKGVEDGRRASALRAGLPRNSHKAVSGVTRPQGVKGSGLAGPGETSRSPWTPLDTALAGLEKDKIKPKNRV